MRTSLPLWLLATALAGCGPSSNSSDAGSTDEDATADAMPSPSVDAMPADLDSLLADLRSDRDATMLSQSRISGWPAPVDGGYLVVSTEGLPLVAGDHDDWAGTSMTQEDDFYWAVISAPPGSRYKFTDGDSDYRSDAWSRAYVYDDQGLMSLRTPTSGAHLQRHFGYGAPADGIAARMIRVWVPNAQPTHLLYAHDGQNLFDPNAIFGGWKLMDSAPEAMMIVGIDNSGDERVADYTHVSDRGVTANGDAYADFVEDVVRPLIASHYGEPEKLGIMGSSLGGLISLHIADRFPGEYDFAASLSGVLGWGSIFGTGTDTMITRYQDAGHRTTALYIDSGGNGDTCVDSDMDGTNDDDPANTDGYCETRQMEAMLLGLGYEYDVDMWHWHEPNAEHNEAAWAARVFRPLQNFKGL